MPMSCPPAIQGRIRRPVGIDEAQISDEDEGGHEGQRRRHHHQGQHGVEDECPAWKSYLSEGIGRQRTEEEHADDCRAAGDDTIEQEPADDLPGEFVVFPAHRPGRKEGHAGKLGGALEGDDEGHDQRRDHQRAEYAQSRSAPGIAAVQTASLVLRGATGYWFATRHHAQILNAVRILNCVLRSSGQVKCMPLIFLGPYVTHVQNRRHEGD